MKLNWKVRFKNPVWLTGFIGFILATIYQGLAMFDIAPAVPEETWAQMAALLVQVLTLLGVLVDPTTKGLGDSERAQGYDTPRGDGAGAGKLGF